MTTPDNISVVPSDAPFEVTLQRLREAIAERGLTLFAEIDHAGNARAAGLEMPPSTVLIFGSARAGTPLMLKAQVARSGRDVLASHRAVIDAE